jgi:hypothetical protein
MGHTPSKEPVGKYLQQVFPDTAHTENVVFRLIVSALINRPEKQLEQLIVVIWSIH